MPQTYTKTFEDFLYDHLEDNSEVYASVHIGEDKIPKIAENEKVDKVIMFEGQKPFTDLEQHFSQYENITFENGFEYFNSAPADAEFISPPGNQAEYQITPAKGQILLNSWAEKSDQAVADTGKTMFLDYSWKQAVRGKARSEDYTLDKVHDQTENALQQHFDETETVIGPGFSGVLAQRENQKTSKIEETLQNLKRKYL